MSLLALLGGARLVISPWPSALEAGSLESLPWRVQDVQQALRRIGGWRSERLDLDRSFLGSVHFTQRIHRSFQRDGVQVALFVGLESRGQESLSGRSSRLARPGPRWEVASAEPAPDLRGLPDSGRLLRLRSAHHELLALWWREGDCGFACEALRAALALDRSPWRRDAPLVVVRAVLPIQATLDGPSRARAQLVEFGRDLLAALSQARRGPVNPRRRRPRAPRP